jgi:hypothetical protein
MIRTQVRLYEKEHNLAKAQARVLGISLAEFVRRAIRQALLQHEQLPWMRFAGMVETGDSRPGQSIDDIVYGPDFSPLLDKRRVPASD